jgi:acyl carrier protein
LRLQRPATALPLIAILGLLAPADARPAPQAAACDLAGKDAHWRAQAYARARKIVIEHLGADPKKVTEKAAFTDLGADSLDVIELTMAFEEEFDVEIPDDVCGDTNIHIRSLADLLAFLRCAPRTPHLMRGWGKDLS